MCKNGGVEDKKRGSGRGVLSSKSVLHRECDQSIGSNYRRHIFIFCRLLYLFVKLYNHHLNSQRIDETDRFLRCFWEWKHRFEYRALFWDKIPEYSVAIINWQRTELWIWQMAPYMFYLHSLCHSQLFGNLTLFLTLEIVVFHSW